MTAAQIEQVRRFNRAVTQRTGALETSYLRRGRPLGEARLLFEVGTGCADVATLRRRLGLDSGYASRLLRSLEAQRLIRVTRLDGDGRRRQVSLTPQGVAEYAAYEARSDDLACSLLASLTPARRDRLLSAMAEVERLIRSAAAELRLETPSRAAAQACLTAYFRELSERFEAGFDPARSNPATEAEMTPPAGYLVLAWLDGEPIGCGALKCGRDGIGEVKRMWTAPHARGLGIARRILRWLEAKAHDVGLRTLRLETNRSLREAQALYRTEGYREVAPFNAEPYAHHWFEKDLQAPQSGSAGGNAVPASRT